MRNWSQDPRDSVSAVEMAQSDADPLRYIPEFELDGIVPIEILQQANPAMPSHASGPALSSSESCSKRRRQGLAAGRFS